MTTPAKNWKQVGGRIGGAAFGGALGGGTGYLLERLLDTQPGPIAVPGMFVGGILGRLAGGRLAGEPSLVDQVSSDMTKQLADLETKKRHFPDEWTDQDQANYDYLRQQDL